VARSASFMSLSSMSMFVRMSVWRGVALFGDVAEKTPVPRTRTTCRDRPCLRMFRPAVG
jgi:hypothetical protein